MNILVGCEYSGIVSEAFAKLGHRVISCDNLYPGENIRLRKHIICDVFEAVSSEKFDMAIFFPPCTYLCNAGQAHINSPGRRASAAIATEFVRSLWDLPIPRICIENPTGSLSTSWRKPSQIIFPWYFGDNHSKDICLWLKHLPKLNGIPGVVKPAKLTPMQNHTNGRMSQAQRSKRKSLFFPAIAEAMAWQWNFFSEKELKKNSD